MSITDQYQLKVSLNRHQDKYTIFNEDESVQWYRGQSTRTHSLTANVQLANSKGEVVTPTVRVDLDSSLVYEDRTEAKPLNAEPILIIRAGSSPFLDPNNPLAAIRFRITEVSSKHDNRRFKLCVSASPSCTIPISAGFLDASINVASTKPAPKAKKAASKTTAVDNNTTNAIVPNINKTNAIVSDNASINILTRSLLDGLQVQGRCVLCNNSTSGCDFFSPSTHHSTCSFVMKMLPGMSLPVESAELQNISREVTKLMSVENASMDQDGENRPENDDPRSDNPGDDGRPDVVTVTIKDWMNRKHFLDCSGATSVGELNVMFLKSMEMQDCADCFALYHKSIIPPNEMTIESLKLKRHDFLYASMNLDCGGLGIFDTISDHPVVDT